MSTETLVSLIVPWIPTVAPYVIAALAALIMFLMRKVPAEYLSERRRKQFEWYVREGVALLMPVAQRLKEQSEDKKLSQDAQIALQQQALQQALLLARRTASRAVYAQLLETLPSDVQDIIERTVEEKKKTL